jgi:hypothetical protein
MQIPTVGIDLAKNVFHTHGVNEHGKAVLRKQMRREQVAAFSRICRAARSGWKLAVAHTTGRASSMSPVTQFASWPHSS